jgi:hypothetical protein
LTPAPRHLSYHFAGYDEAVLGFGDPQAARRILIMPPLFDEMNRVRAMLVGAMRELAGRNVATFLPDIPGCNDSLAPIFSQSIESWRDAAVEAAHQLGATHVASVRSGALIAANTALPHWRLASVKGASLLKTMLRTRIASDKEAGRTSSIESLMADANGGPIALSGYALSAAMLAGLDAAIPEGEAFDVTLGDGLAGKPLWLRAEPQEDAEMSAALAVELDRWSASCGG